MRGMRLAEIMDEVAQAAGQITGITNTFGYPPSTLKPEAIYVSYPERISYNEAYDRGECNIVGMPVVVVSGRATDRESRDRVAVYAAADGPKSLPAKLERWRWQTCDDLTVMDGTFDVESIAGVEYLCLVLKVDIAAPGRD